MATADSFTSAKSIVEYDAFNPDGGSDSDDDYLVTIAGRSLHRADTGFTSSVLVSDLQRLEQIVKSIATVTNSSVVVANEKKAQFSGEHLTGLSFELKSSYKIAKLRIRTGRAPICLCSKPGEVRYPGYA